MGSYGGVVNTILDPFDVTGADDTETPSSGEVSNSMGTITSAYSQYAPTWLALETGYSPLYTKSNLQNLATALYGSGDTPGLLKQYSSAVPTFTQAATTANTAYRTANASDYSTLAPQLYQTMSGLNTQGSGLLSQLNTTASEQLAAGNTLSADQMRLAQQSNREGSAARGLGYGVGDLLGESLATVQYGDTLQQQRQDYATEVAGLNTSDLSTKLGYISSLLSGTSSAPASAQTYMTQASGTSGAGQYGTDVQQDVVNTAYNAESAADITDANIESAENSY